MEVTMLMLEYLTAEEVAEKLRVSTDTILREIKRKKLVAYKISGQWRITPADLQTYMETVRNIKPDQES
jgi:excisionase family DNA binding protein